MEGQPPLRTRKMREEKNPACDRCRKKKLKCDASQDYGRSCSRCAKDQLECIVPDERRMKLVHTQKRPPQDARQPYQTYSVEEKASAPSSSIQNFNSNMWPSTSSYQQQPELGHFTPLEQNSFQRVANAPTSSSSSSTSTSSTAQPRTLGPLHVGGGVIDDCFAQFNRHYARLVPILSSEPSPDATYDELPLKFWTIVAVGSRKLESDDTLMAKLNPHIESLAFASFIPCPFSPYAVFEALLILTTWPISDRNPFSNNFTFFISSTIVTLILQAGLHRCVSLQAVYPDRPVSNLDAAHGATLWAHGVATQQSAMILSGFASGDHLDTGHLMRTESCCRQVPSQILLRARLTSIVSKSYRTLSELGMEKIDEAQDRALKGVMSSADAEIRYQKDFVDPSDPLDNLNYIIARLQVRSMALLLINFHASHLELTLAFEVALATITQVASLQKSPGAITEYLPDYVFQAIVLAACILLKLLKSYPPDTFNSRDGTTALLSAISLCSTDFAIPSRGGREFSTPARVAKMLSGVWSHENAFRDEGGLSYIQPLKIRNRLTASIVVECFSWWRRLYIIPRTTRPRVHQGRLPDCSMIPTDVLEVSDNGAGMESSTAMSTVGSSDCGTTDLDISMFRDEWNWGIDWGYAGI